MVPTYILNRDLYNLISSLLTCKNVLYKIHYILVAMTFVNKALAQNAILFVTKLLSYYSLYLSEWNGFVIQCGNWKCLRVLHICLWIDNCMLQDLDLVNNCRNFSNECTFFVCTRQLLTIFDDSFTGVYRVAQLDSQYGQFCNYKTWLLFCYTILL